MKTHKFLSFILALTIALILPISNTVAFADETGRKKGDVNGDNSINMEDVVSVQRYIAKLDTFEGESAWAADVTYDNEIKMIDVTQMQKYIAKLITKFVLIDSSIVYSRIYGEITYKYNNFVGTRGDDGAKVILIPKKSSVKYFDNELATMFVSGKYDSGIIVKNCDGYGRFDTGDNYIPAGEYLIIIVSRNTRNGSEVSLEVLKDMLGNYLSDSNLETLQLFIGFKKCVIDNVTLEAGYSCSINHHFGITYF